VARDSDRWIGNREDGPSQALDRVAVQPEALEVGDRARVLGRHKIRADLTALPTAVSAQRLARPTRKIESFIANAQARVRSSRVPHARFGAHPIDQ